MMREREAEDAMTIWLKEHMNELPLVLWTFEHTKIAAAFAHFYRGVNRQ